MPKLISLQEAKALGLRKYFTGRPCKRGHVADRDLHSRCLACRQIDSIVEHRKYYIAHKEHLNEISRARYANLSPDEKTEARKRWSAQRREYAAGHREHERLRRKSYYLANKEKYVAYVHTRNANKKHVGGRYTPDDIARIKNTQHNKCAMCRKSLRRNGEIDHIVPISRGGSNFSKNLQLLCRDCNRAKSARDPVIHARSLGYLL